MVPNVEVSHINGKGSSQRMNISFRPLHFRPLNFTVYGNPNENFKFQKIEIGKTTVFVNSSSLHFFALLWEQFDLSFFGTRT